MRIKLLAAGMALSACSLLPQATTASVLGTVADSSGSVVHGATITIRSRQTGQVRNATTEGQGNFEFPFLAVGEYALSVEKPGFQKAEVGPFSLSVDQIARIDVKLTVGQTNETVQVAANAILLQTEN